MNRIGPEAFEASGFPESALQLIPGPVVRNDTVLRHFAIIPRRIHFL
jgi:hypothetical protein